MNFSKSILLLSGSLSAALLSHAGEESIVRDLVHEAALAEIGNDSSKAGLAPDRKPLFSGWRMSFSSGLSYQRFGKLQIRGGAHIDSSIIPSLLGSAGETFPDIGSATALGERTYNDGFVNQTGPTPDTGRTWFWGYQNASQINSDGNLVMSATGMRQDYREAYENPGQENTSGTLDGITPRFDVNLTPPPGSKLPFQSILASFSYFSDNVNGDFTSFTGEQVLDHYRIDYRETFDTSGLILPGAGYGGTLAGPGVTIPNLPNQRETTDTLTESELATLRNDVNLNIKLDGFSLAIGPTFEGSFAPDWQWQASFGPTLNLYHYKMRQSEQTTGIIDGISTPVGASYRDSKSGNEFGLGVFLRGGVSHQLTEEWKINGYLQAEVGESFRISNGVSSFKVDPSGYSIGFGVAHSF